MVESNRNLTAARNAGLKVFQRAALGFVIGYALIFFALSAFLSYAYIHVIIQGGGFVPGFELIQFRRLIAFLAPYLALPIAFVVALIFYRQSGYALSMLVALSLLIAMFGVGQAYLRYQPDPIKDNFGARAVPAPGFLVLTAYRLPPGFTEKRHHYSKREYSVDFVRATSNGIQYLHVVESDITRFVEPKDQVPIEFNYQGKAGRVYSVPDRRNAGRLSHYLFWLNPPKQRLMLSLSSSKSDNIAPSQLVDIFRSMREAPGGDE